MVERITESALCEGLQVVDPLNNPFPYIGRVRCWGIMILIGDHLTTFLKRPLPSQQTYQEDNIYRLLGINIKPNKGMLTIKYLDAAEKTHTETFNLGANSQRAWILLDSIDLISVFSKN